MYDVHTCTCISLVPQFAGIMRPFEDVCKLKGDFTRDDFLEYDGLENVSNVDLHVHVRVYTCT